MGRIQIEIKCSAAWLPLQKAPDTAPPGWRQPRLNPAGDLERSTLATVFGDMTFEGEVTKSVMTKTFSARTQFDDKV